MPIPAVSALYGAAGTILNVALAARVSLHRMNDKIAFESGSSKPLLLAMRAHGNNVEYFPLALLLLVIVELCGGASLWLHVAGGTLVVSRVVHAIGIGRPTPNLFRQLGTGFTWLTMLVLSGWMLWLRRGGGD